MRTGDKKLLVSFIIGAASLLFGCDNKLTSQSTELILQDEKLVIQDDGPCPGGVAAFTKNVYTPILRQSCVECHDANQDGPPHSTADVNAS